MIDSSLKTRIREIIDDFSNDESFSRGLGEQIDAMWNDCIDQGAFGYSAHYEAVVPKLPRIFQIIMPLIHDTGQIQRLMKAIPSICKGLPHTSTETVLGYVHEVSLHRLKNSAAQSRDFDEFIQQFEE
ncbi:MAG: hypothetical protein JW838_02190 [Spirochaetes bacterium]|nr:hypothetical protein [Spirochaetota bacterium]